MKNNQKDMFEYFANIASKSISGTEKVGRYGSMQDKEKNIFQDIKRKLDLDKKKNILDIGCGCGTVVADIIDYVKQSNKNLILNDSIEVLQQIKLDEQTKQISFVSGRFPNIELDNNIKLDAIILYSVLHYVALDNIYLFIDSMLSRLLQGGAVLIADIPNMDKRDRFNNSDFGKEFNRKWQEDKTTCYISENYPSIDLSHFNDKLIFEILTYIRKKQGFNAYLLPQNDTLPFGYIRDDILIEKL